MHILLILIGTGAAAWVLQETDYILPVTAALIVMLIITAMSPEAAVLITLAAVALVVVVTVIAFLPQVLGFLIGALIVVVCLAIAGRASADEYREKMPYDICVEAGSDILEAEYTYWPVVKQVTGKDFDQTIQAKGDKQVEVTCTKNELIIRKGPREVQLQTEVKPGK